MQMLCGNESGGPFVLEDNKTYDAKGAEKVWCITGQSGFDKRQCTVQLKVLADGSAQIHLISLKEKVCGSVEKKRNNGTK